MKGIIFTEFLEMVEKEFGLEVLDRVTSLPSLSTGGSYTSVGNYPHGDMMAMVGELQSAVGVPTEELVFTFGKFLLSAFVKGHPRFFEGIDSSIVFLSGIESVIHSEVRKLYEDAVLPTFECEEPEPGVLVMHYRSRRPLADVAHGLIHGAVEHFGSDAGVERLEGPTKDAHSAIFRITLKESAK